MVRRLEFTKWAISDWTSFYTSVCLPSRFYERRDTLLQKTEFFPFGQKQIYVGSGKMYCSTIIDWVRKMNIINWFIINSFLDGTKFKENLGQSRHSDANFLRRLAVHCAKTEKFLTLLTFDKNSVKSIYSVIYTLNWFHVILFKWELIYQFYALCWHNLAGQKFRYLYRIKILTAYYWFCLICTLVKNQPVSS